MKILVVGSGGREHAIIRSLSQSSRVEKLYCSPGNGGISAIATCFDVKATDIEGMKSLAKKLLIDYVFVAPDDPLAMGMVDELNKEGIKTFGPKANAAIIESSKVFSKALMKKYNIPTAKYEAFTDSKKAIDYIKSENSFPTVIKADGLALGKGVIIAQTIDEAEKAVNSMLNEGMFGDSSKEIVVEEFLTGVEVTVLAFTDGETVVPMISSMDHKRAFDNDKGLNTGGMGTIAPNPYYTNDIAENAMNEIFLPTIHAMKKEGRSFSGCIYFGLMLTPNGAKVIEYNARFGDPEAQVVLPMIKTDLVDIMEAIWEKKLSEIKIDYHDGACACVVLASGGYPEQYETGRPIRGLDENGQIANSNAYVYHAGTKLSNGELLTNGGRVLGITCMGETLEKAILNSYEAVNLIDFDKKHFRKDIGKKALEV